MEKKYDNVVCAYLKENSGFAGKPRNIGLNLAKGQYIMFLDPDDIYLENICEFLYNKISEKKIDMVSVNFGIRTVENKISWDHIGLTDYLNIYSLNEKPSLLILPPSIWTKIYKKEFLLKNNIKFNEYLPGQDALFMYEVLLKANGISYYNESLVVYGKRDYSKSSQKSVTDDLTFNRLLEYLNIYEIMYQTLAESNPDVVVALNSHISYWTLLLQKSSANTSENLILIEKCMKLLEKINQYPSNNLELLNVLNRSKTYTFINLLNFQNNKINEDLILKEKVYEVLFKESVESNTIEKIEENSQIKNDLNIQEKISIITYVYNAEKYLHDCLNSLLHQNFTDFEIICIEDASTDRSAKILDYFIKKDSRIKVIKNKEKIGPNKSRNIGIKYSKGEYIHFIDSNDWIDENTLELLYHTAKKENTDVILYNSLNYDMDKKMFFKPKNSFKFNIICNKTFNFKDIDNEIIFEIPHNPFNKFFKKSFLINNSICFEEKLYDDYNIFFFKTIFEAEKIFSLKNYYYNKRVSNESMKINNYDSCENLKSCEIILNYFKNNALYDSYKKNVLNYIVNSLQNIFNENNPKFEEKTSQDLKNKILEFILKNNLEKDFEENLSQSNLNFINTFKL